MSENIIVNCSFSIKLDGVDNSVDIDDAIDKMTLNIKKQIKKTSVLKTCHTGQVVNLATTNVL